MKYLSLIFMAALMFGCGNTPKPTNPVNVMILIDESSSGSLAAGHPASKTLVNGISDVLNRSGVNVHNDVVLRLDDFGGNRFSAGKAQLIDKVKNYRGADIDYAVVITLDASVRDLTSSKRVSTRSFGQTINVKTGRVEGSFEDVGRKLRASNNCNRPCLSEKLTESAKSSVGPLAEDISAHIPQSNDYVYQQPDDSPSELDKVADYVLIFDGFSRRELAQIEDYLVIFSGYEDMQYSHTSHNYAEVWYQSGISETKLSRNLNRMLDEMRKQAVMQMDNTRVHIRKLTAQERKPKFDVDGWE